MVFLSGEKEYACEEYFHGGVETIQPFLSNSQV